MIYLMEVQWVVSRSEGKIWFPLPLVVQTVIVSLSEALHPPRTFERTQIGSLSSISQPKGQLILQKLQSPRVE